MSLGGAAFVPAASRPSSAAGAGDLSPLMRVDLFDYDLPAERIALEPMSRARRPGCSWSERTGRWPNANRRPPGFPAARRRRCRQRHARHRGAARRRAGPGDAVAHIEATLIKRVDDSRWRALVRPAKKLRIGERIRFGEASESMACLLAALDAEVEAKGEAGEVLLNFAFSGAALDEAIERLGQTPLPPYIASRRPAAPTDRDDYQTVFARSRGGRRADGRAAFHARSHRPHRGPGRQPASRHAACQRGTFLPVKAEDTADHVMHSEWGRLGPKPRRRSRRRARGRPDRRDRHHFAAAPRKRGRPRGILRAFEGETSIFITPGYRFRAVDILLTNFHLPRSTLLMLVSAFSGAQTIKSAYAHAIARGFGSTASATLACSNARAEFRPRTISLSLNG